MPPSTCSRVALISGWVLVAKLVRKCLAELPAADSAESHEFDLEYRRQVFQWAAAQVRETVSEKTWEAFWNTHVRAQSMNKLPISWVGALRKFMWRAVV